MSHFISNKLTAGKKTHARNPRHFRKVNMKYYPEFEKPISEDEQKKKKKKKKKQQQKKQCTLV